MGGIGDSYVVRGRREHVDVPKLVVALNEADQVIDIDAPEALLTHIISHAKALPVESADPAAETSDDRSIEFFSEDGEELEVVVSNAWYILRFLPTGRRVDVDSLRGRIQTVLDHRFAVIAEELHPPQVRMPVGDTWPAYLRSCAELVAGDRLPPPPPGTAVPFDRRGWWHNTFVHGGNV